MSFLLIFLISLSFYELTQNIQSKYLLVEVKEQTEFRDILSRANYGSMQVGETRKFEIDKNKKKDCKLPGEGVVEIDVKKEESTSFAFTFRASLKHKSLTLPAGFIYCDYGYVALLKTQEYQNCGIGKILTQLCLNEEEIHKVAGNEKNGALIQMETYIKECEKKEACKKNDGRLKKLKDLQELIRSHCSKLIWMEMKANNGVAKTGAHVYFNSGIASGFTEMFMTTHLKFDEFKFYPKNGLGDVKSLQARYSDDGYMVDGDEKTAVWGWNWFFCHP